MTDVYTVGSDIEVSEKKKKFELNFCPKSFRVITKDNNERVNVTPDQKRIICSGCIVNHETNKEDNHVFTFETIPSGSNNYILQDETSIFHLTNSETKNMAKYKHAKTNYVRFNNIKTDFIKEYSVVSQVSIVSPKPSSFREGDVDCDIVVNNNTIEILSHKKDQEVSVDLFFKDGSHMLIHVDFHCPETPAPRLEFTYDPGLRKYSAPINSNSSIALEYHIEKENKHLNIDDYGNVNIRRVDAATHDTELVYDLLNKANEKMVYLNYKLGEDIYKTFAYVTSNFSNSDRTETIKLTTPSPTTYYDLRSIMCIPFGAKFKSLTFDDSDLKLNESNKNHSLFINDNYILVVSSQDYETSESPIVLKLDIFGREITYEIILKLETDSSDNIKSLEFNSHKGVPAYIPMAMIYPNSYKNLTYESSDTSITFTDKYAVVACGEDSTKEVEFQAKTKAGALLNCTLKLNLHGLEDGVFWNIISNEETFMLNSRVNIWKGDLPISFYTLYKHRNEDEYEAHGCYQSDHTCSIENVMDIEIENKNNLLISLDQHNVSYPPKLTLCSFNAEEKKWENKKIKFKIPETKMADTIVSAVGRSINCSILDNDLNPNNMKAKAKLMLDGKKVKEISLKNDKAKLHINSSGMLTCTQMKPYSPCKPFEKHNITSEDQEIVVEFRREKKHCREMLYLDYTPNSITEHANIFETLKVNQEIEYFEFNNRIYSTNTKAYFNGGLITFDATGKLIVSSSLDSVQHKSLVAKLYNKNDEVFLVVVLQHSKELFSHGPWGFGSGVDYENSLSLNLPHNSSVLKYSFNNGDKKSPGEKLKTSDADISISKDGTLKIMPKSKEDAVFPRINVKIATPTGKEIWSYIDIELDKSDKKILEKYYNYQGDLNPKDQIQTFGTCNGNKVLVGHVVKSEDNSLFRVNAGGKYIALLQGDHLKIDCMVGNPSNTELRTMTIGSDLRSSVRRGRSMSIADGSIRVTSREASNRKRSLSKNKSTEQYLRLYTSGTLIADNYLDACKNYVNKHTCGEISYYTPNLDEFEGEKFVKVKGSDLSLRIDDCDDKIVDVHDLAITKESRCNMPDLDVYEKVWTSSPLVKYEKKPNSHLYFSKEVNDSSSIDIVAVKRNTNKVKLFKINYSYNESWCKIDIKCGVDTKLEPCDGITLNQDPYYGKKKDSYLLGALYKDNTCCFPIEVKISRISSLKMETYPVMINKSSAETEKESTLPEQALDVALSAYQMVTEVVDETVISFKEIKQGLEVIKELKEVAEASAEQLKVIAVSLLEAKDYLESVSESDKYKKVEKLINDISTGKHDPRSLECLEKLYLDIVAEVEPMEVLNHIVDIYEVFDNVISSLPTIGMSRNVAEVCSSASPVSSSSTCPPPSSMISVSSQNSRSVSSAPPTEKRVKSRLFAQAPPPEQLTPEPTVSANKTPQNNLLDSDSVPVRQVRQVPPGGQATPTAGSNQPPRPATVQQTSTRPPRPATVQQASTRPSRPTTAQSPKPTTVQKSVARPAATQPPRPVTTQPPRPVTTQPPRPVTTQPSRPAAPQQAPRSFDSLSEERPVPKKLFNKDNYEEIIHTRSYYSSKPKLSEDNKLKISSMLKNTTTSYVMEGVLTLKSHIPHDMDMVNSGNFSIIDGSPATDYKVDKRIVVFLREGTYHVVFEESSSKLVIYTVNIVESKNLSGIEYKFIRKQDTTIICPEIPTNLNIYTSRLNTAKDPKLNKILRCINVEDNPTLVPYTVSFTTNQTNFVYIAM